MVWFNVDDGFPTHPKVLSIPRADRMAATGLWTTAGSWCSKHMTDGHLGAFMLEEWGANPGSPEHLVASGLWEITPEGYVFHNWAKWQRTREEIEAGREKERVRKQVWRDKKADHGADSSPDLSHGTDGGTPTSVPRVSQHPNQAKPIPSKPTLLSTKDLSSELRPEIDGLCTLLHDLIVANGSKAPTVTPKWRDAARLMLVNDGRDAETAARLMRWCQASPFWRGNVLSMPKFRAKYDQLRLAANAEFEAKRPQQQSKTDRAQAVVDIGRQMDAEKTHRQEISA